MTMGINCIIRQSKGTLKEAKALYPEVVNAAGISSAEFEEMVCRNRGLNPAQVKGVISGMSDTLAQMLLLGHSVKVDGIGTFSVDVKGKVEPDSRGVLQLRNASVKKIRITADAALRGKMKDCRFTLRNHSVIPNADYDEDLAATVAGNLLADKAFFTCSDFMAEAGVSRSLARKMLGALEQANLIHRTRKGRNYLWTE